MTFKILAIKGYAGAGKTTVEKALYWLMSFDNDMSQFTIIDNEDLLNPTFAKHAFLGCKDGTMPIYIVHRSFASPLKDYLASLIGCHPGKLHEQSIKESLQPDLFGDLTVRDMHLKLADIIKQCTGNEDIFADSMRRYIMRIYKQGRSNVLFVIDDLRYPFEHEMLQHLVLEDVVDDYICLEVKKPNAKPIQHNSESEQSKIVPDFTYINNYDLKTDMHQLVPVVNRCLENLDNEPKSEEFDDEYLSKIIDAQIQERLNKRQQRLKDAGVL